MNNNSIKIAQACDSIKELLLEKNFKYGDSALNPTRIFSKSSTVEQLLVRIDDKLSRIKKGSGLIASDEDVIQDLIGYLILLKIALADSKLSADGQYFEEDPWKLFDEAYGWSERCPD